MADGEGEQQGSVWPLPKFHFLVHLGDDMDVKFLEVSGLRDTSNRISPWRQPNVLPDQDAWSGQGRQRDHAQGHLRQ